MSEYSLPCSTQQNKVKGIEREISSQPDIFHLHIFFVQLCQSKIQASSEEKGKQFLLGLHITVDMVQEVK